MDSQPRVLILIPSRYQSSRFPGKPLSLLKIPSLLYQKDSINCEMIERTLAQQVYINCLDTGYETRIVTDHDLIETTLSHAGVQVTRVNDDVPSGTERIALAYQRHFKGEFDFIINVQGDEPLLEKDDLKRLINFHHQSSFDITTLVRPHHEVGEIENPNIVKAAKSEDGKCLYFSRSPIPYERKERKTWFQHIGVYCYRAESLEKFVQLPESTLEKIECLEQLRALENGMSLGAVETQSILMGVDTPEDLEKVNAYLLAQKEQTP